MRLYTLDGRFNLCGKRVREARIKAGMSQDTLAAKLQLAGLQIGQMAVSRIETGKRVVPDFDTFRFRSRAVPAGRHSPRYR